MRFDQVLPPHQLKISLKMPMPSAVRGARAGALWHRAGGGVHGAVCRGRTATGTRIRQRTRDSWEKGAAFFGNPCEAVDGLHRKKPCYFRASERFIHRFCPELK